MRDVEELTFLIITWLELTVGLTTAQEICLPDGYSKFELPFVDTTNMIGIG
jgi:hypothetical protein